MGDTCEHTRMGGPHCPWGLPRSPPSPAELGQQEGSVQLRQAPSCCKGSPFTAHLALLLPGASGAGAVCEAAHGCRGSQALGQAVFGTLGHHTLKQEVKGSQKQGRLPEFYYLQKIPLAHLHSSRCISPFLYPPGSPWRSLCRDLELHGPGSKLERGAVPSVPPSRDQETRARKTRLPWSPGRQPGWDMPQQWLWHGAHSEVAPLLRGRADGSRMLACPKE